MEVRDGDEGWASRDTSLTHDTYRLSGAQGTFGQGSTPDPGQKVSTGFWVPDPTAPSLEGKQMGMSSRHGPSSTPDQRSRA